MLKLLIVDDEALVRDGIALALKRECPGELAILKAASGREGLAICEREQPEIIISDVRMPQMNGLDMARALVERQPGAKLIFISAYSEIAYYRAAMKLHAVSFVEKPIVLEELLAEVRRAIELIGAEHILARRAANDGVRRQLLGIIARYERAMALVGEEIRSGNPSPGNKAGGITTLEEKSLGCIHKGGHSPVMEVYDYAKQVEAKKGLVIMDTPGNDPSSVAAMVAGGAQVVVFSTGRGSPTGNPIAPVIKITGNRITFANMKDNIDVDASPLIYGGDLGQLGDELLKLVVEVASGKQTKAESLGYTEMAIARVCNFV